MENYIISVCIIISLFIILFLRINNKKKIIIEDREFIDMSSKILENSAKTKLEKYRESIGPQRIKIYKKT